MKAAHLAAMLSLIASSAFAEKPDPNLTPGDVFKVTAKDVCAHGYSKRTRKVSTNKKREVFRRYGVKYFPHAYEVDHFIPLCLGGSNSVLNLWPQPIVDAVEKDKVESFLCREVCKDEMDLKDAQEAVRTDWRGKVWIRDQR